MAYLLGFTNQGGLPYPDPVTAAYYYPMQAREIPEGIAEMRPGCRSGEPPSARVTREIVMETGYTAQR